MYAKQRIEQTRKALPLLPALASVLLALSFAAQSRESLVVPPGASAAGTSQEMLVQRWWQWANRVPPGVRPFQDPTGALCGLNQSGDIWFLAGTDGTDDISRDCSVPAGKFLFFPVIAMLASATPGTPLDCSRAVAMAGANNAHLVSAEVRIDGDPVTRLDRHRIATPRCFDAYPAAPYLDNPRAYFPAASDGFWLLVRPLPAGLHRIEVHARYDNPGSPLGTLEQVFEYRLEVKAPQAPASPGQAPDYI